MESMHPIPQQISSYQFRLVGDMTLKQFLQLAVGALVSLMFYASPLNPVIKWPLIVVSFLMGVALAFLPIEERPLSTWIFIFFRSIYSPTRFAWKKLAPGYSAFIADASLKTALKSPSKTAEVPMKAEDSISPAIAQASYVVNLEEQEQAFLNKVEQNFIAPNTSVTINTVSTVSPDTVPLSAPPVISPSALFSTDYKYASPQPKSVVVPKTQAVGTDSHAGFSPVASQTNQAPASVQTTTQVAPMPFSPSTFSQTKMAEFSPDASPPLAPTKSNVISGQVLDDQKNIIDGAIIEIKDESGRPVRALKSNKLGHFMTVTPLLNGKYIILCEKEGFDFDPVGFVAEDKIILPMAIWGKKSIERHGSVIVDQNTNQL